MKTIILAGGKGLHPVPYPYILPKPLMPLDGMPVLEILLRRLSASGLTDVTLSVGRLSQLFQAFFQDGKKWGLELKYSLEDEPLGTAGPLTLVEGLRDQTFLVMNGDVLMDLDFADMLSFHHRAGGIATLAVVKREVRIDLGTVRTDPMGCVLDYQEKPVIEFTATIGVNMFEPGVMDYIPTRQPLDIPDLVLKLMAAGEKVVTYQHPGYWMDLGSPSDYQQALTDFKTMRSKFIKEK